MQNHKQTVLFAFTAWAISTNRSQTRLHLSCCNLQQMIQECEQRLAEFLNINQHPQLNRPQPRALWHSPPTTLVKVNFDGRIFSGVNYWGVVVVVRDSDGSVITSLSQLISQAYTSDEIEFKPQPPRSSFTLLFSKLKTEGNINAAHSYFPSQPNCPTPASLPNNPTPTHPMPTSVDVLHIAQVNTQVAAPVNTQGAAPVTTQVNPLGHTSTSNTLYSPATTPLVPISSISQPNTSLSLTTPPPPVCPIAPQVTSMFQVPSVTKTHSMVTRAKVGTFKPKAFVAQACPDVPQSVISPAQPSKPSKVQASASTFKLYSVIPKTQN
nr:hypothetical protein CFP56_04785 [Quercus suber]